jgi:hypothetical protein
VLAAGGLLVSAVRDNNLSDIEVRIAYDKKCARRGGSERRRQSPGCGAPYATLQLPSMVCGPLGLCLCRLLRLDRTWIGSDTTSVCDPTRATSKKNGVPCLVLLCCSLPRIG